MSAVPGNISVDLTQLSKKNDGRFPLQEVYMRSMAASASQLT
jgi:hypothetical protein